MIRFRFKGNRQRRDDIAFIGLSHNNLDALKRGRPIRMRKDEGMLGLAVELVIFAGTDEVAMTKELEDHGFVPKGSAEKTAEALAHGREFRLRTEESNGDG